MGDLMMIDFRDQNKASSFETYEMPFNHPCLIKLIVAREHVDFKSNQFAHLV